MCASALVVIESVFHRKDTFETSMHLYLCTSVGSITSAFSLKILGHKEQRGIIKVVAVDSMVIKFLITDKSIMAERSSVQSQVSKLSTTSAFLSNILVHKGQGKFGLSEDESEFSENNTLFRLLRCN